LPGGDGGDAAMAEPDVAVPSAAAGDAAGAAAAADGAGAAGAAALAAPPADGGAGEQPSGEHQRAAEPAEPAAEPAAGGAGGEGGAAGGDGAARCVACAASAASAVASHALTPHALAAQRSAAAARARSAARTPRHRAPAGALALAARPLMTAISAASTRPGGHAPSRASHAPFAQPLGVTCARLERARTKLASCPDDLEAWEAVLAEARTRPLAEARQLYDSVRPPRQQQRSCALRGCTRLLRRGIAGALRTAQATQRAFSAQLQKPNAESHASDTPSHHDRWCLRFPRPRRCGRRGQRRSSAAVRATMTRAVPSLLDASLSARCVLRFALCLMPV